MSERQEHYDLTEMTEELPAKAEGVTEAMGLLCGEVLAIDPGLKEHKETRKHSSRVEGSFTRANTAFTTAHDGGEHG